MMSMRREENFHERGRWAAFVPAVTWRTALILGVGNRGSRCLVSMSRRRNNTSLEHGEKSTPRKSRRKGPNDIERDRKSRAQKPSNRRPVIAQWNGAVLAQSSNYEFLDGRFFFPQSSVRWDFLEISSKHKFFNPIGKAQLYDIVLKSHSAKRPGAVLLRNRAAAMTFTEVKNGWQAMKGYTCFWKGVKLFHKPDNFQQTLHPGAVPPQYVSNLNHAANQADAGKDKLSLGEHYDGAHIDMSFCDDYVETWD